MGRREREGNAADRLRGEPCRGLARDMGRMVVEDDLDCRLDGVGRVEELEELDEFAAAVAFLEQGMDVASTCAAAGCRSTGKRSVPARSPARVADARGRAGAPDACE
jgi:hypothetical protein